MVNCCVPNCKSESGKKNTFSVSFHDFPLASEMLSLQWINIISRKDWKPSDTSKVCSLHFLPSDYKCGGKLKRLLPNAVPSVFSQQTTDNQLKVTVKKSPSQKLQTSYTEIDTVKKQTQDSSAMTNVTVKHDDIDIISNECHEEINLKHLKMSTKMKTEDTPIASSHTINDRNVGVDFKFNSNEVVADRDVSLANRKSSQFVGSQLLVVKVSNEKPGLGLKMDSEMKLGMEHIKEINAYKAKLRRRDEKIRRLENDIAVLKRKMDVSYMEEKFLKDLATVFKSSKESNIKALFILQQIKSFSHKAAHWDELVLDELVKWRQVSLRGYEKAKSTLLVLPHRTTLTTYIAANKNKEILPPESESLIKSIVNSTTKPNSFEEMFDKHTADKNFNESRSRTSSTENLTSATLTDDPITENPFKDLVDNPLTILSENTFENMTENTFKNSFEEMVEHPFENALDTLTETVFEKLLVNKLDNKLEHILSHTLDETLDNTLDKFLENKVESKMNCFESQLDTESLESILDNTIEKTLGNTLQHLLGNQSDDISEVSISHKRLKLT